MGRLDDDPMRNATGAIQGSSLATPSNASPAAPATLRETTPPTTELAAAPAPSSAAATSACAVSCRFICAGDAGPTATFDDEQAPIGNAG